MRQPATSSVNPALAPFPTQRFQGPPSLLFMLLLLPLQPQTPSWSDLPPPYCRRQHCWHLHYRSPSTLYHPTGDPHQLQLPFLPGSTQPLLRHLHSAKPRAGPPCCTNRGLSHLVRISAPNSIYKAAVCAFYANMCVHAEDGAHLLLSIVRHYTSSSSSPAVRHMSSADCPCGSLHFVAFA